MSRFEYKIIPASVNKGKERLLKGGAEKAAAKLESKMNTLGLNGWEYYRTETYPIQKNSWFSRPKLYHISVLVFRRKIKHVETMSSVPRTTREPHPAPEHQSLHAEANPLSNREDGSDAIQSSESHSSHGDQKDPDSKDPDIRLTIIPQRQDT